MRVEAEDAALVERVGALESARPVRRFDDVLRLHVASDLLVDDVPERRGNEHVAIDAEKIVVRIGFEPGEPTTLPVAPT